MFYIWQVSTNGYFSLGAVPPYDELPDFPFDNNNYMVVAPFAADIDTSYGGSVNYTTRSSSMDLSNLNEFIRNKSGNTHFTGSIVIAAEWEEVTKYRSHVSVLFTLTVCVAMFLLIS